MVLVTSEQMLRFDKHTMEALRVPGIVLMDHAGRAVAQVARMRCPNHVAVLCGKGNNGGDGWSAARWLHLWGVPKVSVIAMVPPDALVSDAKIAADMAIALGVPYELWTARTSLPKADIFLDGLLGTGVNRALGSSWAELVQAVNEVSPWSIAIDVPSGVNASTGEVPGGLAIRADETVCMAAQKLGTAITPGALFSGHVHVVDIGIRVPMDDVSLARWVTRDDVKGWLPKRSPDSHKGTFGRVGIAVGEMHGAACLAGLGAARSGAGLVVLGAPGSSVAGAPFEFVIRPSLAGCSSLVVGPGLGKELETWRAVIANHDGCGVLDADGLRLLSSGLTLTPNRWVLTPHPKECGKLLGISTQEVQTKRLEAARQLAAKTQSVVVLKGFHSLIATPDGQVLVNPTGDASLATAGTGDVLAGIIGGLLAGGLPPLSAAAAGAWLHGRAGELAGQSRSQASTLASDVVENISRAICLDFDTRPGDKTRSHRVSKRGEVDYAEGYGLDLGGGPGGRCGSWMRDHHEE